MYNGQEAAIIRCSDVGRQLKSELEVYVSLSVWQLFRYGFPRGHRPLPFSDNSPSLSLVITPNTIQTGNNHFCIYYVAVEEKMEGSIFSGFTHDSHTLRYRMSGAELYGHDANKGFCAKLNWAVKSVGWWWWWGFTATDPIMKSCLASRPPQ